jgi:nuclear distribution protein NudE
MLAETRAELDDFQQSSKELEEELEAELERTEKAQKDLLVKASRAESERDEWKVRYFLTFPALVSAQCSHGHRCLG